MIEIFSLSRRLALVALAAWILLFMPYPATAFMASCVACVLFPWFQKFSTRFGKTKAAACYAGVLTIATVLPITLVVVLVTPQAVNGLVILDHLMEADLFHDPQVQHILTTVDTWLKGIPGVEGGLKQICTHLAEFAGTTVRAVLAKGIGLAGSALNALFIILLFIMVSLLCVTHGETIQSFAQRILGFPSDVTQRFTTAFRNATRGVLLGILLVAMLQGLLCGIGFSVAGVPQPAFWGLLAACVAPIPFVGTALVWLPAVIWLWFAASHATAFGLFLWCVLAVTGVDNVLRPLFLKSGINASFIVLVLAVLLGLSAFGPIGIFLGPVLIAIAIQAGKESTNAL